jgi:hypothetical protein
MKINGKKLLVTMAAFDGCHKIYIPVPGQEDLFIKSMEAIGWIFDEDMYKIDTLDDLMNIYKTPEFNGDLAEFTMFNKRTDICDANWDVIFKEFNNIANLADFKAASERAQGYYHSFLGDEVLPVEEYTCAGVNIIRNSMGKAIELHEYVQACANLEEELLRQPGNHFGIYQIPVGTDEARNYIFASMRELKAHGITVTRANYELVYTAPFTERVEFLTDRNAVLDNIFKVFNIAHPAGYMGRSVSVSDVIVLRHNFDTSIFYVDSVGFAEIDYHEFFSGSG